VKDLGGALDWDPWFDRWEAQQNCYIPQRLYRFDLMLQWAELPQDAEVRILDLGCGPGSLSFRALSHYPRGRVVAVDLDPVLLAMGRHKAGPQADRIEFLHADLRSSEWWRDYDGAFDLVLSATALHWLSPESLGDTYRRAYRALKPGGYLINSDHLASSDDAAQARFREMLSARQEAAFRASGAEKWDAFWEALGRDLTGFDIEKLRRQEAYWEGDEDGLTKAVHEVLLRAFGFERVECLWQDLGEAVLSAQKPAAR